MRPRPNSTLEAFNYPFWAALLLLWAVVAGLDARTIYPARDFSFLLAFAAVLLRAFVVLTLAVGAGSALKSQLGRPGEFIAEAAALLLTMVYCAAALVFAAQGLPLSQIVRDVRLDVPLDSWATLKYTGFSADLLCWCILGFLTAFAAGLALAALSRRLAVRKGWRARGKALAVAGGLAVLLILAEQFLSGFWKNPAAWIREQQSAPLYAAVLHPRPLASYTAEAAPFRRRDSAAEPLPTAPKARDAVVVLFVMESLRASFVTPEIAPNLERFQRENMSFPRAYSNGNTTLLSWYALFNSDDPIYIHRLVDRKDDPGSPALAFLKKAGVVHAVFESGPLDYLNSRAINFGSAMKPPPAETSWPSLPETDRRAVRRLLQALAAGRGKGPRLYTVFLNSTHAPYLWPPDFEAPFQPALPVPEGADASLLPLELRSGGAIVSRIQNRYMNSVRFVDGLFGEFESGLKALGLDRRTAVVVVGDHGEEFGEHGAIAHGADLYDTQIRPVFAMKFPGTKPGENPLPVSQIDVLPTILDYFGLGRAAAPLVKGRSLLKDDGADRAVLTMGDFQFASPLRRFALTTKDYKFVFDFPLGEGPRPLRVWEILDAEDRPYVPGRGSRADYRAFLDEKFAPRLAETGALALAAPRP